jgi:hypothetical protein
MNRNIRFKSNNIHQVQSKQPLFNLTVDLNTLEINNQLNNKKNNQNRNIICFILVLIMMLIISLGLGFP